MKIIREEEWDTKLKFPWAFVEHRIECQQGTWALFGVHWLVLAWRRRWLPLYWLKRAHVWHVEPGTYLRYGHFCPPWSKCRADEIRKVIDERYEYGVRQGRREERTAQDEHFKQYLDEMKREREERHRLENGI